MPTKPMLSIAVLRFCLVPFSICHIFSVNFLVVRTLLGILFVETTIDTCRISSTALHHID